MVLERATGEHIATYMQRVLWRPLGAEADASWSLDSEASGFEKSESGINARAIDFARFGLLHPREGRNAAGEPVVPARWVESATAEDTSTDPAARYQYWWWVDTGRPGRYYAAGNKGRYIYVAPDKDVVVVRMGRAVPSTSGGRRCSRTSPTACRRRKREPPPAFSDVAGWGVIRRRPLVRRCWLRWPS